MFIEMIQRTLVLTGCTVLALIGFPLCAYAIQHLPESEYRTGFAVLIVGCGAAWTIGVFTVSRDYIVAHVIVVSVEVTETRSDGTARVFWDPASQTKYVADVTSMGDSDPAPTDKPSQSGRWRLHVSRWRTLSGPHAGSFEVYAAKALPQPM